MNTLPASTGKNGALFNCYGQELVPCELCQALTTSTGTKRCDPCWELEKRIQRDPELARKIINSLLADELPALKQPGPHVHFLRAGVTPCQMAGFPKDWPEGHKWSSEWKDVDCPHCLKYKTA